MTFEKQTGTINLGLNACEATIRSSHHGDKTTHVLEVASIGKHNFSKLGLHPAVMLEYELGLNERERGEALSDLLDGITVSHPTTADEVPYTAELVTVRGKYRRHDFRIIKDKTTNGTVRVTFYLGNRKYIVTDSDRRMEIIRYDRAGGIGYYEIGRTCVLFNKDGSVSRWITHNLRNSNYVYA